MSDPRSVKYFAGVRPDWNGQSSHYTVTSEDAGEIAGKLQRLAKLEAAALEALPHLTHDDYCDYIGKKLLTGDESTCNCAMGLAYDHLRAALPEVDDES